MPAKKIVQDIVPNHRRSIRDIPIEHEVIIRTEIEEPVTTKKPQPKKKKNSSGKYLLSFIIIFACIAVIGIALSFSYSKAVVTITPKVTNFDIDGTFTAKKNASNGDLGYEAVTISDEVKQTVSAKKGGAVDIKAKGTVFLYNNYSSSAQTLVAGTRLSGPDGNVYRTSGTISIPGKTNVPGKIEVTVVADESGDDYNMKIEDLKGDFKVVAFKGTDRYDYFYARLSSDLSGGFSGNKMVIDPELQKSTVETLKNTLSAQLVSKLKNTVPEDYILYESAYSVIFDIQEPTVKEDNTAEIKVMGTLQAAIFKSDLLVRYIAGNEIKKFPGETYRIDKDENLQFKVSNSKDFSISKGTPMIFTLKGPISIVGTFSEQKIKDELKGISLEESNAIFGKYASISNAYALLTPFWMRSFPSDTNKIFIEYKP